MGKKRSKYDVYSCGVSLLDMPIIVVRPSARFRAGRPVFIFDSALSGRSSSDL